MNYKLNTLFKKSASKFAANIALEDLQGNIISYANLQKKVNSIANVLKLRNIDNGDRVGILSSKNIDYVSCIFSVLSVNAAYVPLDSSAPIIRAKAIIDDCDLQALFIETIQLNNYLNLYKKNKTITVEKISEVISLIIFSKKSTKHLFPLAYILYTSGSTGVPKGVMHSHESALSFINWSITKFKPQSIDRFVSHAPFHFDLSVFDLYVSISVGATLVLLDEKTSSNPLQLANLLESSRISFFYTTPSTLIYLSNFGKLYKHDYSKLSKILFAGEVFPIEQLKELKRLLISTQFYNLYGPTETNVCTYYKIPKQISKNQMQPYPIGKTCGYANTIINKKGELLVSGKSLMLGYWNDLVKTKSSFYIDENKISWYKTGDKVLLNRNNDLEYTGRIDRMIKRNGFRIELGEIESMLLSNKNILQIAVTASSKNRQTSNIITTHLVFKRNKQLTELKLYEYCCQILPKYMIPDQFKYYKKLPVTSTNKIDYKKLSLLHDGF